MTPEKVYNLLEMDGQSETTPTPFEIFGDILKSSSLYKQEQKPTKIKDELARREKLKNENLEQDIKLRRFVLRMLLGFLATETFVIFLFAFLQATQIWKFKLEEWSFRLLVGATITQIYLMLRIAVEYLFPKSRD